jgi:predicted nucleic acid-binding protein
MVTSEHIITDLGNKLRLERISGRYGIADHEVDEAQTVLRRESTVVDIDSGGVRPVTGDPEDDAVLATARLGGARYLVTNDTGLLGLSPYEGVRIVTPGTFRDLLPE